MLALSKRSTCFPVPPARGMLRHRQVVQHLAPAGASAALQKALDAETDVTIRTSPEHVIQAKAAELAKAGPGGWTKALAYAAVCVPLWLIDATQLFVSILRRPSRMWQQPDPSQFKLTPPFPLHEEYLTVNGVKLHAVSPGRQPTKPLMLMLHGFPECWYSWRHQMAAFAQDYDVVALDMRGYTTSDKPQGISNYSLDVLASDVKGAVEALGHSSCTLVAHDWGGVVAWVTAGMYGEGLVQQLIVLGAPHIGIAATNMSIDQYKRSLYMMNFQAPYLPELNLTQGNAQVLDTVFTGEPMGVRNKAALTEADMAWFKHGFCQPGAATGALNYYRALVRWQLFGAADHPVWRALKRQLEMPVLVLYGGHDMALGGPLLDGIEAAVPHSTVMVLNNCSHWVQQDYPSQVTRLMREWLGGRAKLGKDSSKRS